MLFLFNLTNPWFSNFLSKRETNASLPAINPSLFSEPEETALASVIAEKSLLVNSSESVDYNAVLTALSDLKTPVDAFFDKVMVNVDDEAIRKNRLALLQTLHELFLNIADISVLQ